MKSVFLVLIFIFSSTGYGAKKVPDWYKKSPWDFQEFIDDWPQLGTAKSDADYDELLELQVTRTNAHCELGLRLRSSHFSVLFGQKGKGGIEEEELGFRFEELLTEQEIENHKKVMNRALNYSSKVTKVYKEHYERDRPSRVDPRVKPCAHIPEGKKSYPSSHTGKGYVGGCLMKLKLERLAESSIDSGSFDRAVDLYARAQFFEDYGIFMGDLRKIVGVHHPTDVEAGRNIGRAVCDYLWNEPEFQSKFMSIPL